MTTSLMMMTLIHGSASSASLPVIVKVAAGGSGPVYPSMLGRPCSVGLNDELVVHVYASLPSAA